MHHVDTQDAKMDECLKTSKTIICIWKAYSPQEPTMMLSESTIGKNCICAMEDVIICGTSEGFIQVWNLKVVSPRKNKIIDMTRQYSIHDNETIENQRCTILSIVNVSNTMIASLDSRGVLEIW